MSQLFFYNSLQHVSNKFPFLPVNLFLCPAPIAALQRLLHGRGVARRPAGPQHDSQRDRAGARAFGVAAGAGELSHTHAHRADADESEDPSGGDHVQGYAQHHRRQVLPAKDPRVSAAVHQVRDDH